MDERGIVRLALDLDQPNPELPLHSREQNDLTTNVEVLVRPPSRSAEPYFQRINVMTAFLVFHFNCLRNVSIQPVILPLQKLLLNQAIDVPLDTRNFQRAPVPRGLDRLGDQLGVADALPRFQDPHNRGLGLVVSVCGDALVGFFVLGGRLFELHRVDLDAVFRVAEVGVEGKCVGRVDVPAFGVLG